MFRKTPLFIIFAATAILFTFSAVTFAQNAPISGTVSIKKADGTTVPLEGATVEAFRTDIKASAPAVTTDKRGAFSFLAIQPVGTYVLSVSAPGAEPTYFPNVKPGTSNLKFEMKVGDGRRLTPEEVREVAAMAAAGGQLTEEQKKAQADQAAKIKEVTEKNAKIEEETKIIQASLKDGNAAFEAKNWDLAIAKYDEGINANPTYAGSAPILMNNKGAALRERAVITYNANVRSTDAASKVTAFAKVRADLGEAAETHHKSWTILKSAPANEIAGPVKDAQIITAVRGATDTFRLMTLTEQVEDTKIPLAKEVLTEYQGIETDPIKKETAKVILGDLYRVAQDMANAIAEYRKVIETSPDNIDALAGLGISLVNDGYADTENAKTNNDQALAEAGKAKLQEGANFLQKYAAAAPDNHKFKGDAVGLIESLKADQKITPQKVATPARRRGN